MPKIELELTDDEMYILLYVVPFDSWGDPLKDVYELEQRIGRKIPNPYAVLESMFDKLSAACSAAVKK